jgi:hypothetical protein
MATSGDRTKMTQAKNYLKSKVAKGTATDQDRAVLKGLCKQLGDMSCAY